MKNNKKGFTFIELIIVIAILGIIAVVAIPKYEDLTTNAKNASMKGIIGGIRAAIAIQYAKSASNGTAAFPSTISASMFHDGNVPKEVINDDATVSTSNENPIATFADDGGYIYNSTTGEVRFDVAGYHTY